MDVLTLGALRKAVFGVTACHQTLVGISSLDGVSPDSVGIPNIDETSHPPRIAESRSFGADRSFIGQNFVDM
jgi:hypothetical protein